MTNAEATPQFQAMSAEVQKGDGPQLATCACILHNIISDQIGHDVL